MSKEREPVDNLITVVPGKWKFDAGVARHFDDHVRKSIPLYDEVQRMVVEVSQWFIRDGSTVYDIGSSTGHTISLLLERHADKANLNLIGIEKSAPMIDVARKKCPATNVQFLQRDVYEMEGFPGADLVLCLYTLHFVPVEKRELVLQRVYRDLSDEGAFVMLEKIVADNPAVEDMWREIYWDFKRERGLNENMIREKAQSLKGILHPLTLHRNIALLREAGFTCIAPFMQWCNFVGLLAIKTAKHTGSPLPIPGQDSNTTQSGDAIADRSAPSETQP